MELYTSGGMVLKIVCANEDKANHLVALKEIGGFFVDDKCHLLEY